MKSTSSNRTTFKISKSQLVDVAVNSIRVHNDLSEFHDYIKKARESGLLTMTDNHIEYILEEYEDLIYSKGMHLQDEDAKLCSYKLEGELSSGKGMIEGNPFDGFKKNILDIYLLTDVIPNFVDAIPQPRPSKYYLLDHLLPWPIYKVVGEFSRLTIGRSTRIYQLYLLGRDRGTGHPFALGLPAGFIDKPIEACNRWTFDAHSGDEIIEV